MTFTGSPPWRAGVALTVAVLLAHGLLFQAVIAPGPVSAPSATRVVTLRTIEAGPTAIEPTTPVRTVAASLTPSAALPAAPPVRQNSPARSATRTTASPPAVGPSISTATTATASGIPADNAAAPLALPSTDADVALPASRQLRYDVTGQARGVALQGESTLLWQQDGDRYEARLEVRLPTLPPRVQHSSGRVGPAGLEPSRFSEKTRSEQASHFDRGSGQVVFSANRAPVALERGAQDRLSVLLQLAGRIAASPQRYAPGSAVALQTVGPRDADTWVFRVEGHETLQLPGGPLPALKLLRPPRHAYDTTLELWLAPGMDYVPVRTRLTQAHGDWLEQQWSATDR